MGLLRSRQRQQHLLQVDLEGLLLAISLQQGLALALEQRQVLVGLQLAAYLVLSLGMDLQVAQDRSSQVLLPLGRKTHQYQQNQQRHSARLKVTRMLIVTRMATTERLARLHCFNCGLRYSLWNQKRLDGKSEELERSRLMCQSLLPASTIME